MSDHGERIATLEEQNRQLARSMEGLARTIKDLDNTIGHLEAKITGWKGAAFGASIVVSALWAAFLGIKQFFT